jgi:hypothetical protein
MAGFLDQYGAGDRRREKILRAVVISLVALGTIGGTLTFIFYNYRQERQAKRFFELLAGHDYKTAYAMWGCTDAKPCRDYPFPRFMEDWGPQGERADVANMRITRSRSCGSGVILTVDFGKSQEEKLWVERSDLTIGFSPYAGCPPGR